MRRPAHGLIVLALLAGAPAAADGIAAGERRSGSDFMAPETQAMQADDTSNPGMLWVVQGAGLWEQGAGASGLSCAGCHGAAADSMRGVAARYPALDAASGKPVDLTGRINQCRTVRQGASALVRESNELLALTTFVAHQSRGMPISPPSDPGLDAYRAAGRELFTTRMGQLDLSCANCHDDNWRGRLAGSAVTQAHPTGYPLYRLEWQGVGSLQRRMRNCMIGVRAEPFAAGSDAFIALELYLMQRAAGMAIETPGVRP
ncbi:sulfur oxidation c-type cytochrome SoxA [Ancylobacter dichloromethanicus]|uniref:SoxAX cytochrome complex subunit A n=1 Tax=Ancylobacter dichloromethanicus TaxID=518825 RepID=A0A9W6J3E8_9HYPH|nr:sulfur oxidation c-type cytochrome SoxA [Ancylobacter dichloromethanicus]MBS7556360.1 sulfur oxidation c-type cytochrome SoxA [Ancylobacter dichloromethanicus]GLK70125.1 SoxAX cytochrome complex subunit A [Ancylobacter dichloromethanicus]